MSILWVGYIVSERPFYELTNNRIDVVNEIFYFLTLELSFSFIFAFNNAELARS
jgi:hypothetical protein